MLVDFPTEALAARLARVGVVEYEGGDVGGSQMNAPGKGKGFVGHRREKGDSDSDSDSD